MAMTRVRWVLPGLLGGLLSCSGGGSSSPVDATVAADATLDAGAGGDDVPARVCRSGRAFSSETPSFRGGAETAAAWGLGEVVGKRLATGDLDNDGYPDLIVWTDAVNARTDFSLSPAQYNTRVLLNRPREGGGRRFVEATQMSQFLSLRTPVEGRGRFVTTVAFADIDNDGDLDAYTGTIPTVMPAAGQSPDPGDRGTILLNNGQGVFSVGPESDATPGPGDAPQTIGAVFLDHNADGQIDLFVGYHAATFGLPIGQQSQLFAGAGDGRFTEVTAEANLLLERSNASLNEVTNNRPLYGISACDVNGDGRLDLIGAAYGRQFNLLMTSEGSAFRDESAESGVGGDENRNPADNLTYQCYCAANPGRCPSTVPAPRTGQCGANGAGPRGTWRAGIDDAPWRLNGNTFSIACGDVDNDGDIDLYTGEIAHPDVGLNSDKAELLVNESDASGAHFRRPGRSATGLVPPVSNTDEGILSNAMFDFDNDGRLDVWAGGSDYPRMRGWLFHQNEDGRFSEVSAAAGIVHACPVGTAIADFDRDGDLDVVLATSLMRTCSAEWMGRSSVRIYENLSEEQNWLQVRLVGRGAGGANRAGLGARVRVTAGGVTQTREIQGNWGIAGVGAELVAHFGLGSHCDIEQVEVRWPDAQGTVETFRAVRANHEIELRQGERQVRYVTPRP
ncbi:MAG: CRTAC1 family protein [Myxococcales bacterium]|nr:CRTAC1 family protein [Myxococcales bacterium]